MVLMGTLAWPPIALFLAFIALPALAFPSGIADLLGLVGTDREAVRPIGSASFWVASFAVTDSGGSGSGTTSRWGRSVGQVRASLDRVEPMAFRVPPVRSAIACFQPLGQAFTSAPCCSKYSRSTGVMRTLCVGVAAMIDAVDLCGWPSVVIGWQP